MVLANFINPYNRRARLFPALIVLLPLGLSAAAWTSLDYEVLGTLGVFAVTIGVASFLSQLARDAGKNKEADLFRLWGGKPSAQALSYRSGVFDPVTLQRTHRKLHKIEGALVFPDNADDELADIETSMVTYKSASNLLVSSTRDKGEFPLLFEENINYGYRRNLWGMKPSGLVTSALGLVIAGTRIATLYIADQQYSTVAFLAAVIACALFVLWLLRITPSWVRLAADAYARQLVTAVEQLQAESDSSR